MRPGSFGIPVSIKLRIPDVEQTSKTMGAKLHWSKGKQPRPSIKVPKSMLSVKRGDNSYTTRRLA